MMDKTHYDVAIVGGRPAGLQVALILARTRRRVIIFDSPEPPRNAASQGVHNFVGLDGLTPAEIREQAWQQIAVYNSTELRAERVVEIHSDAAGGFSLTVESGSSITTEHVVLALGFRDIYPEIPGFTVCWGNTIIGCPYCDGYENRDRMWGLVITSQQSLEHMPHLYRNWTATAKIILSPDIYVNEEQQATFRANGIEVYQGQIVEVQQTAGRVEAVMLNTGERVAVDTLWWRLHEAPQPLTRKIIANFSLEVNDNGSIKTDAQHQTSVRGLWAVGDVLRGWAVALGAAYQGSLAAYAITRTWYTKHL